jgi:hypothetical protein
VYCLRSKTSLWKTWKTANHRSTKTRRAFRIRRRRVDAQKARALQIATTGIKHKACQKPRSTKSTDLWKVTACNNLACSDAAQANPSYMDSLVIRREIDLTSSPDGAAMAKGVLGRGKLSSVLHSCTIDCGACVRNLARNALFGVVWHGMLYRSILQVRLHVWICGSLPAFSPTSRDVICFDRLSSWLISTFVLFLTSTLA